MVCPSTTAQQSAVGVSPDSVSDTCPEPVFVDVDDPARRTAVTVSVDVKLSWAWTRFPVSVQVKVTLVTPQGIVGAGVDDAVVGGVVVLVVEEDRAVVLTTGAGPMAAVVVADEVGTAVEVGTEVAVGVSVAVAALLTVGSVLGVWDPAPIGPIEEAAWVCPTDRLPPRIDTNPHPRSATTIARIPAVPMRDIERMPTAPPAPGGRWRPTPGSIVIAGQDKPRVGSAAASEADWADWTDWADSPGAWPGWGGWSLQTAGAVTEWR